MPSTGTDAGAWVAPRPCPRLGPAQGRGSPNATSQKSDARVTGPHREARTQADTDHRSSTQSRHGRKCRVSARNVVGRNRPAPAARLSPRGRSGGRPPTSLPSSQTPGGGPHWCNPCADCHRLSRPQNAGSNITLSFSGRRIMCRHLCDDLLAARTRLEMRPSTPQPNDAPPLVLCAGSSDPGFG